MTLAFVLSGGGNYGALQAGALEVLLRRGIQPDLLVGVSAGALNAAWLAGNPSLSGVEQLQRIWLDWAPRYFTPPSRLSMLLRLTQGKDSLLPSESMLRFIRKWALSERKFGDFIHPRLYVVATRLSDGAVRVFGDDPSDSLLDALMASTALPPLFPPWVVDGVAYVDGGVVSDLPLSVAVERGADEIYALMVAAPQAPLSENTPRGVLAIGGRAFSTLADRTAEFEIDHLRDHYPRVRLHLIRMWPDRDPGFWNFSQAEALIAAGKRAAILALAREPGEAKRWPGWVRRLRDWLQRK